LIFDIKEVSTSVDILLVLELDNSRIYVVSNQLDLFNNRIDRGVFLGPNKPAMVDVEQDLKVIELFIF
jgi:hypothetical protein